MPGFAAIVARWGLLFLGSANLFVLAQPGPLPIENLPQGKTLTIDSVCAFVNRHFFSDSAKVRVYYTWIAHNVDYDLELLKSYTQRSQLLLDQFSSGVQNQRADSVMKSRKAVCEGLCNLMNAFCKGSGIVSVMVPGITLAPGEEEPGRVLHTWNAVKTSDGWRLLDVTWAGGFVNNQGRFTKRFSLQYFFLNPEEFGTNHWPLDAMWQLTYKPRTKRAFLKNTSEYIAEFFNYNDSISQFLKVDSIGRELLSLQHYLWYDEGNKLYQDNYDQVLYNHGATLFNKATLYFEDYAAYARKLKGREIGMAEVQKCIRLLNAPKNFLQEGLVFARGKRCYSVATQKRWEHMVQSSAKKLVEVNRMLDSYHSMKQALK